MTEKARYATAHRLRFPEITTPDQIDLSGKPEGALSWKFGPCGPVGPNGYRLPSDVWCAVGLYRERLEAEAAVAKQAEFMPYLPGVVESWHVALVPIRHGGECNHLDRGCPGEIFEISPTDPDGKTGGKMVVLTTAGYVMGPALDMDRVIDFRRNVDVVNAWMRESDGCLGSQTFTPHTFGDDGYTISLWRDDEAMLQAFYRAGKHRVQMDRHRTEAIFDRASFTRFRVLGSAGSWGGVNPLIVV